MFNCFKASPLTGAGLHSGRGPCPSGAIKFEPFSKTPCLKKAICHSRVILAQQLKNASVPLNNGIYKLFLSPIVDALFLF